MGVGVTVRDGEDKSLQQCALASKKYITDPTTVEAFATWKTVLFGRNLGLCNVNFGGNALTIVQAFKKDDNHGGGMII